MKETVFTLVSGKEIPERLNGAEIRYTLPETLQECLEVCQGKEDVLVSVFNEGFNLNHRQKIAKRYAAREGSTVETITQNMLAHVPGVRAERGEGKGKVISARKAVENDLLAELEAIDPAKAAAYRERLAAIKPRPKAATGAEPAAEPSKLDKKRQK